MTKPNFQPFCFIRLPAGDCAQLPPLHRDPFDRLLIAQARSEGMRLVTADDQVMAVPVDGSGAEFHVGKAEPLFPINVFVGPRISSGFEVAPDGKRFLVNSAGDVEAPRVVLISNWTSALTK